MCSTKCKAKCITKYYYYYSYILGTYHSCDKLKIKKSRIFQDSCSHHNRICHRKYGQGFLLMKWWIFIDKQYTCYIKVKYVHKLVILTFNLQTSTTLMFNSLTTRGPGPGPYIDHVLYKGPRPRLREHLVNCRHGNIFCPVHL